MRQNGGNLTCTGDVTAFSDRRLKDNITLIANPIYKVQQLNGVTFTRNDLKDNSTHTGLIAQDVEKVLPEAVKELNDGTKTVAYGNTVGLLVEAIKEQQKQIEELKNDIIKLKGY